MKDAYGLYEDFFGAERLRDWARAAVTRQSLRRFTCPPDRAEWERVCYESGRLVLPDVRLVCGRCENSLFPKSLLNRFDRAERYCMVCAKSGEEEALFGAGLSLAAFQLDLWQHGTASCVVDMPVRHTLSVPAGFRPVCLMALGKVDPFPDRTAPLRRRRAMEKTCEELETYPAWARKAAAGLQIAPSRNNAQPWRLTFRDGELQLWTETDDSPDAGIAALYTACALADTPHETSLFNDGPVAVFRKK